MERLKSIATIEQLHLHGVPSASIALLEEGKVSTHVITNGPENEETVYQACSISKAITALAVARMVDDGLFSYDTLVAKHVPESIISSMVKPATAHWMQKVTVRMLLSHTSGLSQGGFPGYAGEPATVDSVLSGNAPSNTPKVRFLTFPGARFKYAGGGFTLLQVFLEIIAGTSFAELMQDAVLKPLGMRRSWYGTLPSGEENYTVPYCTAEEKAASGWHRFSELAAAGLWTTPSDLLKAIRAIQESLRGDFGILRSNTAKEMLTATPQARDMNGMAVGWTANDSIFAHTGYNIPGYSCIAFGSHGGVVNLKGDSELKMPEGTGVAIMTNGELGFDVVRKIASAIFYIKGWRTLEATPNPFGREESVPFPDSSQGSLQPGWSEWCGKWEHGWALSDNNGPSLSFDGSESVGMDRAAAPTNLSEDKPEHTFVVKDADISVRLAWEGDSRVLEIIQTDAKTVLKR